MYVYTYVHVYTYIVHTYLYTCTYTYMCMYMHYVYTTSAHTCTQILYICITQTCKYTFADSREFAHSRELKLNHTCHEHNDSSTRLDFNMLHIEVSIYAVHKHVNISSKTYIYIYTFLPYL